MTEAPTEDHLAGVRPVWPTGRFGHAVDLADGGILCMGPMSGPEAGLLQCVSQDRGLTWSEPAPVRERGTAADSPPFRGLKSLLFRLKSGALGMTYGSPEGLFFRKSDDQGETWSPPMGPPQYRTDPDDPATAAGWAQTRPIVLPSGRLIKPRARQMAHTFVDPRTGARCALVDPAKGYMRGRLMELEGHTREVSLDFAFVSYTDDEGETWHRNEDGELFVCMDHGAGPIGSFDEVTGVAAPDGSVVLFGRTELGQLFKSISTDDGVTWSQPEPTGLAAGCAPADAVRIPGTDDVLLVWTQASADEIRRGLWRARLSSAISSDSCRTWKHFRCLEANGVPPYPRVPAPEPGWVRSDPLVPDIPVEFAHSSYPRLAIVGGFVVVTYCFYLLCDREGYRDLMEEVPLPERDAARAIPGLQIWPTDWFYDAD